MKKNLFAIICIALLTVQLSFAQNVGINNTDPQAALDLLGRLRMRALNVDVSAGTVNSTAIHGYYSFIGSPASPFTASIPSSAFKGTHLILSNNTSQTGTITGITTLLPNEIKYLLRGDGVWLTIYSSLNSSGGWATTGNAGTNPTTNFLGTTDLQPLKFRLNNEAFGGFYPTTGTYLAGIFNQPFTRGWDILMGKNAGTTLTHTRGSHIAIGYHSMKDAADADQGAIAIGDSTLMNNTVGANQVMGQGINNIAIGMRALQNNTIGARNIAIGHTALMQNIGGWHNTALGSFSMPNNQYGTRNTALGAESLLSNTNGSENIALGVYTMYHNTSGSGNIAIGNRALHENTDRGGLVAIGDSALLNNGLGASQPFHAKNNVAVGKNTLQQNTIGYENTAVGYDALKSNTIGVVNTAIGYNSMQANTIGIDNTAVGHSTLQSNISGTHNVAVGEYALRSNTAGTNNTAIGSHALQENQGNDNTIMGYHAALNNGSNTGNVGIGSRALIRNTRSNIIAIGDSALANNGVGTIDPNHGLANTGIGHLALYSNTMGNHNTSLGYQTLHKNLDGSLNTAIGSNTLYNNENGTANVAIGYNSMADRTSGNDNTAIGAFSLQKEKTGGSNTAIGHGSMFFNNGGIGNTALGFSSLYKNVNGEFNTMLGYRSGYNNISGSRNIFIGTDAGLTELGSNKLYIDSEGDDQNNALIFGDFAADSLRINGKTSVRNNAVIQGFTKLGGYGASVPNIKMKELTMTTGTGATGVSLSTQGIHGLDATKILSVSVLVTVNAAVTVPPSYDADSQLKYNYYVGTTNIVIQNQASGCAVGNFICNKTAKVLITYKE